MEVQAAISSDPGALSQTLTSARPRQTDSAEASVAKLSRSIGPTTVRTSANYQPSPYPSTSSGVALEQPWDQNPKLQADMHLPRLLPQFSGSAQVFQSSLKGLGVFAHHVHSGHLPHSRDSLTRASFSPITFCPGCRRRLCALLTLMFVSFRPERLWVRGFDHGWSASEKECHHDD